MENIYRSLPPIIKTDECTEPVCMDSFQKWYNDVTLKILKSTQYGSEKFVDTMMITYYRILKDGKFNNREKLRLMDKILIHMKYFYFYYKELEDSLDDTNYFIRMEDILTYYCNLELKLVQNKLVPQEKKQLLYLVKKLCKILGVYLHHRLKYILHVLLRMEYDHKHPPWQLVLRSLYHHFLSLPAEPFSEEVFCRYYLVVDRYKNVALPEEKEKLGEFVFRLFGKTKEYLSSNTLLKSLLTPPSSSITDIITDLVDLKHKAIKAYFDYVKTIRKEETPKLRTEIDPMGNSGDFAKTYSDVLFTFSNTTINNTDVKIKPEFIELDSDVEAIEDDDSIINSDDDGRKEENRYCKIKKKKKASLMVGDIVELESDDSNSDGDDVLVVCDLVGDSSSSKSTGKNVTVRKSSTLTTPKTKSSVSQTIDLSASPSSMMVDTIAIDSESTVATDPVIVNISDTTASVKETKETQTQTVDLLTETFTSFFNRPLSRDSAFLSTTGSSTREENQVHQSVSHKNVVKSLSEIIQESFCMSLPTDISLKKIMISKEIALPERMEVANSLKESSVTKPTLLPTTESLSHCNSLSYNAFSDIAQDKFKTEQIKEECLLNTVSEERQREDFSLNSQLNLTENEDTHMSVDVTEETFVSQANKSQILSPVFSSNDCKERIFVNGIDQVILPEKIVPTIKSSRFQNLELTPTTLSCLTTNMSKNVSPFFSNSECKERTPTSGIDKETSPENIISNMKSSSLQNLVLTPTTLSSLTSNIPKDLTQVSSNNECKERIFMSGINQVTLPEKNVPNMKSSFQNLEFTPTTLSRLTSNISQNVSPVFSSNECKGRTFMSGMDKEISPENIVSNMKSSSFQNLALTPTTLSSLTSTIPKDLSPASSNDECKERIFMSGISQVTSPEKNVPNMKSSFQNLEFTPTTLSSLTSNISQNVSPVFSINECKERTFMSEMDKETSSENIVSNMKSSSFQNLALTPTTLSSLTSTIPKDLTPVSSNNECKERIFMSAISQVTSPEKDVPNIKSSFQNLEFTPKLSSLTSNISQNVGPVFSSNECKGRTIMSGVDIEASPEKLLSNMKPSSFQDLELMPTTLSCLTPNISKNVNPVFSRSEWKEGTLISGIDKETSSEKNVSNMMSSSFQNLEVVPTTLSCLTPNMSNNVSPVFSRNEIKERTLISGIDKEILPEKVVSNMKSSSLQSLELLPTTLNCPTRTLASREITQKVAICEVKSQEIESDVSTFSKTEVQLTDSSIQFSLFKEKSLPASEQDLKHECVMLSADNSIKENVKIPLPISISSTVSQPIESLSCANVQSSNLSTLPLERQASFQETNKFQSNKENRGENCFKISLPSSLFSNTSLRRDSNTVSRTTTSSITTTAMAPLSVSSHVTPFSSSINEEVQSNTSLFENSLKDNITKDVSPDKPACLLDFEISNRSLIQSVKEPDVSSNSSKAEQQRKFTLSSPTFRQLITSGNQTTLASSTLTSSISFKETTPISAEHITTSLSTTSTYVTIASSLMATTPLPPSTDTKSSKEIKASSNNFLETQQLISDLASNAYSENVQTAEDSLSPNSNIDASSRISSLSVSSAQVNVVVSENSPMSKITPDTSKDLLKRNQSEAYLGPAIESKDATASATEDISNELTELGSPRNNSSLLDINILSPRNNAHVEYESNNYLKDNYEKQNQFKKSRNKISESLAYKWGIQTPPSDGILDSEDDPGYLMLHHTISENDADTTKTIFEPTKNNLKTSFNFRRRNDSDSEPITQNIRTDKFDVKNIVIQKVESVFANTGQSCVKNNSSESEDFHNSESHKEDDIDSDDRLSLHDPIDARFEEEDTVIQPKVTAEYRSASCDNFNGVIPSLRRRKYKENFIEETEDNEYDGNTSSTESVDPPQKMPLSPLRKNSKKVKYKRRNVRFKGIKDDNKTLNGYNYNKEESTQKILYTSEVMKNTGLDDFHNSDVNDLDHILSEHEQTQYFTNSDWNSDLFHFANTVPLPTQEIDSPAYDIIERNDYKKYLNEFNEKRQRLKSVEGQVSGKCGVTFNEYVDTRYITPISNNVRRNKYIGRQKIKKVIRGRIKCFIDPDDERINMETSVVLDKISDKDLLQKYKAVNHNTIRTCIRKKLDTASGTSRLPIMKNNVLSKGSSSFDDLHENIRKATVQGRMVVVNEPIPNTKRRGRPRKVNFENEGHVPRKRRKETKTGSKSYLNLT